MESDVVTLSERAKDNRFGKIDKLQIFDLIFSVDQCMDSTHFYSITKYAVYVYLKNNNLPVLKNNTVSADCLNK